jgi:uncharacterized protein YceH (UPF0502 family)
MDQLNDADVRVLGALVEKAITTPDYYPLSMHALIAACNQSSNRHPVVSFDEETTLAAVRHLRAQSLVRGIQKIDSRVTKYEHLMAEAMELSARELGVMCVLMLRGPQTVGEIRTRIERLAHFESLSDVETTLNGLMERSSNPLVTSLPRQAGQKEVRYAHLLSGEVTFDQPHASAPSASAAAVDRIAALEAMTSELRNEVTDLRRQLEEFRKQFE